MAALGEKTAKPSKTGAGKILHEFARDTNIEGVNNAGRSPSNIRKAIWLLIFIFLAALTVQDLVSLTKEFLSWPVDVSTRIDHKDAIPFPSVTICNQNRVSCRRLKEFLARCQVSLLQNIQPLDPGLDFVLCARPQNIISLYAQKYDAQPILPLRYSFNKLAIYFAFTVWRT